MGKRDKNPAAAMVWQRRALHCSSSSGLCCARVYFWGDAVGCLAIADFVTISPTVRQWMASGPMQVQEMLKGLGGIFESQHLSHRSRKSHVRSNVS